MSKTPWIHVSKTPWASKQAKQKVPMTPWQADPNSQALRDNVARADRKLAMERMYPPQYPEEKKFYDSLDRWIGR